MKSLILKYKLVIIIITVLSVLLIGGTYALLAIELFGEKSNTIIVGTLELELDESTCTGINISNGVPVTDTDGMKEVACTFTLENTGEVDSDYTIYLDDDSLEAGEERMQDKFIKYSLIKNTVNTIDLLTTTGSNPNRVIDNGVLNVGDSNSYELRLWIDSGATAEVMGTIALTKLRVASIISTDFAATGDSLDNVNVPQLADNMIPVLYNEVDQIWEIAGDGNWYSYKESKWANAVTLTDSSNIKFDSNYVVGTEILLSDIESMYVWIPRYSYTPSSIVSSTKAIDINFVDINQEAHPAFTFGSNELSGFWISKFELGESSNENIYYTKPNINSVHNVTLNTLFTNIKKINSDSDFDTHLIKNTEWGAVSYLSQSIYGVCSSTDVCTNIHNNSYYNQNYDIVTGCSGDVSNLQSNANLDICPIDYRYDSINGMKASTTLNITGVYDMAGGRAEYVMGNMSSKDGSFNIGYSGFSNSLDVKYYDIYSYNSLNTEFINSVEGDAIKELGPTMTYMNNWNNDNSSFFTSMFMWMYRGGRASDNIGAGIFSFNSWNGEASNSISSRAVVSMIN